MKRLTIITLLLISSLQTVVGQEKSEIDLITSGKWYLVHMDNDGVKRTFPKELKEDNWMIFHSDGKHEVMSLSELHFGTWKYSKKEKTIKMINKGGLISNQQVVTLNENELVLKIKEDQIEILMKFKK